MQQQETRIAPPGLFSFDFSELRRNRELLYFFVWRDLKVKYKQTYLGILWAIIQPALLMLVFYFVFAYALNGSVGMNYPVYAFSGLILWGLFSSGISHSSESLLSNAPIIRKIYFPRILIPLSSLVVALVDFLFAFAMLVILLIIFRQPIHWNALLFFPLAIAVTFVSSLGIGALLAALNIKYRDFRYVLPFTLQFLFFGSQIVYSIGSIKTPWIKPFLYVNPLNGALELFRAPFQQNSYWPGILISFLVSIIFLVAGLFYFKKTESYFADLV